MPKIKLIRGRGFAKLAGAGVFDREKVQALKQGKSVELSIEEISWLKPGIYQEVKEAPAPAPAPEPVIQEEEAEEEEAEEEEAEEEEADPAPPPRRRRPKRKRRG